MKPERAAPAYVAAFREIVSRIQATIAPQRKSLKEPLRIFVAGGAAAHLYTGARVSEDIDATLSRRVLLPENLEVSYRGDDGSPRLLYCDRQYNDKLGLLHENREGLPGDPGGEAATRAEPAEMGLCARTAKLIA